MTQRHQALSAVTPAVMATGCALVTLHLSVLPAAAHGGTSGAQEFVQHNAVTVALILILLVATLALVWVNLGPRRRQHTLEPPRAAPRPESLDT
ncbi:MAG TPA: hypothetical protein VNM48_09985 [Chloroflexota bacterium]|nr:hypothetical protein [Chloroflexota bacterium]